MAERMTHHAGSLFDFEPLAREYDRWYDTPAGQAHDRVQEDDVRRLLRPASAGQTLLDVGCGTGHWSAFFAEMGYQVTGVDVSRAMIEVARSAVPQCTFQVADAHELPCDDGVFDVVASMATLEFLPDQAAAIREMARCARKHGHLLVGTLNRLAPLNQHRIAKGKPPTQPHTFFHRTNCGVYCPHQGVFGWSRHHFRVMVTGRHCPSASRDVLPGCGAISTDPLSSRRCVYERS